MNQYSKEIVNILIAHDIYTVEDLNDKYYLLPREVQMKIEMLSLKSSFEDMVRYGSMQKEEIKE